MARGRSEKVQKRYDAWSGFYDLADTFPILSSGQTRKRKEAIRILDIQPDDIVMDAGCGSGLIIPWLAEYIKTGKVIGVDFSEKMLKKARARANKANVLDRVTFRKDDIENSKFHDGSFERIIATFTLTSVPHPKKCLKEMERLLKVGGKLVIMDTGRPQGRAGLYYALMRRVMRWAGYTYIDRDVEAMVRNGTKLDVVKRHHFGKLLYCLECVK